MMQIHGGAWVMGDKGSQALPLMYHLASRGWICVAANYRLSPSVGFPTHLEDCKRALCWIRELATVGAMVMGMAMGTTMNTLTIPAAVTTPIPAVTGMKAASTIPVRSS